MTKASSGIKSQGKKVKKTEGQIVEKDEEQHRDSIDDI